MRTTILSAVGLLLLLMSTANAQIIRLMPVRRMPIVMQQPNQSLVNVEDVQIPITVQGPLFGSLFAPREERTGLLSRLLCGDRDINRRQVVYYIIQQRQ